MNPYEVLEIKQGATVEEIKAAYHRLAKQWHPDRFNGEQKLQAEQKFRMLSEAFNMLKGVAPRAAAPQPAAPTAIPDSQPAAPPPSIPTATGAIPLDLQQSSQGPQEFFRRAESALADRRPKEALGYIEYVLKLEKEKYEYHVLHAKILEAIGTDKRAFVTALENCLRLNKKDAEAAIKLAETYQALGMYTRATRYWEWAANIAPDHPYFKRQREDAKAAARDKVQDLAGQVRLLMDRISTAVRGLIKR